MPIVNEDGEEEMFDVENLEQTNNTNKPVLREGLISTEEHEKVLSPKRRYSE